MSRSFEVQLDPINESAKQVLLGFTELEERLWTRVDDSLVDNDHGGRLEYLGYLTLLNKIKSNLGILLGGE